MADWQKVKDEILEALMKQEALKPLPDGTALVGDRCPRCNGLVFRTNYCPECGQRLGWEDGNGMA